MEFASQAPVQTPTENPGQDLIDIKRYILLQKIKALRNHLITLKLDSNVDYEQFHIVNEVINFIDILYKFYNALDYSIICLFLQNIIDSLSEAYNIKLPKELQSAEPEEPPVPEQVQTQTDSEASSNNNLQNAQVAQSEQ